MIINESGQGRIRGWSGSLISLPAQLHLSRDEQKALQGQRPPPSYIPKLTRINSGIWDGNGSPDQSEFYRRWCHNRDLLSQLTLYEPVPLAREFEKRLTAERNFHLQLVLAMKAAECGSSVGKNFILKALKETDYERCRSTLDTLRFLGEGEKTPDWVPDAMIAALADQRPTNESFSSSDTPTTVSYIADEHAEFARWLARAKCRRAVPVLIDLVKLDHHRNAIEALGEIGDPAAIPVLMAMAKEHMGELEISARYSGPEDCHAALRALAKLKASGTVEMLLPHVVDEDIVSMLETLGDPRAIPVLQQIVATGKPRQIKGSTPKTDRSCVEAARIALATLEPGDPIPRYCAMIQDRTLNGNTRFVLLLRLGKEEYRDPRALPVLLEAARKDPSGTAVDGAIYALGEYKCRTAIAGLIALFNADFTGKDYGKTGDPSATFRGEIANSLEKITGQTFGPDPVLWQEWWSKHAQDFPDEISDPAPRESGR
ncbi:MAG: HEAT repeat domain-containing protein [Phycisphaerae bacterium]